MKKTLLLLAALSFATAGTTFAQTAPAATNVKMKQGPGKDKKDKLTPEQKADHGVQKMTKDLGLAPDQQARVKQILLARQQEAQALKTKTGTDRKAGHEQMKALRDRYDAQLKGALTAEQFAKYQQQREEHKGHGGHHGGHGPQEGKTKVKTKA